MAVGEVSVNFAVLRAYSYTVCTSIGKPFCTIMFGLSSDYIYIHIYPGPLNVLILLVLTNWSLQTELTNPTPLQTEDLWPAQMILSAYCSAYCSVGDNDAENKGQVPKRNRCETIQHTKTSKDRGSLISRFILILITSYSLKIWADWSYLYVQHYSLLSSTISSHYSCQDSNLPPSIMSPVL